MITLNTLDSYRQFVMHQIDMFKMGKISEDDMFTIREFGYDLCYEFEPKNSSELYLQIQLEDDLELIKIVAWGY